jgi:hypothetical protein
MPSVELRAIDGPDEQIMASDARTMAMVGFIHMLFALLPRSANGKVVSRRNQHHCRLTCALGKAG